MVKLLAMKNFNSLLFFAVGIIIYSCSSPEKDGDKRGIAFCNCINDVSGYSSSYSLQQKRDSYQKASMDGISKDYNTDAAQFKRFTDAFENTTNKMMLDINSALTALITTELSDKVWAKEGETRIEYYLCSFNKGTFRLLNCNGGFDFIIQGDSIVFDNKRKTVGTIELTPDNKLSLSIPAQSINSQYRLADARDKIVGKWYCGNVNPFYADENLTLALYSNGSCTMSGQGYSTEHTKYSISDSVLNVKGVVASKLKMTNTDLISWWNLSWSRIKSRQPDELNL